MRRLGLRHSSSHHGLTFAAMLIVASSSAVEKDKWHAVQKHALQTHVDGCCHVFLDVGSNIGVQVRKLFEPQLYPRAKETLSIFDELFGTARRRDVCALGLEGNARHRARLLEVEEVYSRQGWRTKFLVPTAAAASDGWTFLQKRDFQLTTDHIIRKVMQILQ